MGSTRAAERERPGAVTTQSPQADARDQHSHGAGCGHSLEVGAADHAFEVAAERAADAAVRRMAEAGTLGASAPSSAARASGGMGPEGGTASADVSQRIGAARGAGAALPQQLRSSMEAAFDGANFGGVRLHTGNEAADLSAAVGAAAFTVGKDVFIGSSTPDLGTAEGQHTLAHELAHTLQPEGAAHRASVRRNPPAPSRRDLTQLTGTITATAGSESTSAAVEGFGHVASLADAGSQVQGAFSGAEGYEADYTPATGINNSSMLSAKGGAQLTYAGTAFASFALIADGAAITQAFIDKEKATTKAELILGAASDTAGLMSSAQGAKKTAQELANGEAGAATGALAGVFEEVAGSLAAIKAGYKIAKDIYKLISKADDMDNAEKIAKTGDVLKSTLEAGKGIIDALNGAYHKAGTMTTTMLHAAPGIGIALNAMDVIIDAVKIATAYISYGEMKGDKRKSKAEVQTKAVAIKAQQLRHADPTLTDEAATALATAELGPKKHTLFGFHVGNRSGKAASDLLKAHHAANPTSTTPTDKDHVEGYETSRALQQITAKRIKRGILNIGTTLPAIAGDIATLSGVGAAVGGGLKAGSAGAKAMAAFARFGKQFARDNFGWGDQSKTTSAKTAMYDSLIKNMLRHITAANEIDTNASDPLVREQLVKDKLAAQDKAQREVSASGMRPRKIVELRADPAELYKEWVGALKSR